MKHLGKASWFIWIIQFIICIYVLNTFKVDDVTLNNGTIVDFNTGWTIIREDGSSKEIELPYYDTCEAEELVVIENTIPEEFWGKTLSLLTADKNMRVLVDDKVIYEFGINDERTFGKTPGSVKNFIDMPTDLEEGRIRIELSSPYKNYGACIDSMTLADRDISILQLIENNYLKFACAFLVLVAGIGFLILSIIQRIYSHSTDGMEYLCAFCFVSFFYYCIETKSMNLFYGNQTFYSIMVFFSLMLLPLFFIPYYLKGVVIKKIRALNLLLILAIINAVVQLVLQLTNLVDFMDMAWISHIILFVSIWFILINVFIANIRKEENSYWIDCVALLILGFCGMFDIGRSYVSTSEHLEKYSRYGTTVFCLFMLISHMVKIVRSQTQVLKEREERANAANQAKSIFLAQMSHEIRTPINAVLGMNKMILRESTENNILQYSADIESSAQALLSVINEILDLSKIEAGKMVLTPAEYQLSSLLHDVYTMTKVRAKTKELEFKIEVSPDLPVGLIGDDVKIRQVLTNLLSNAVKYTHKGFVSLKVSGKCEKDVLKLYIEVQDTGIGIKEDDLPKLFSEFERFDEDKNRSIEGTGLGMSITIKLLKLMGSSLQVESEYEKGSRFFFTLDQKIVDSTPIGDFSKGYRKKIQKEKQFLRAPGKQILLVDDNVINRKVFTNLLKQSMMKIDEAESGQACIQLVKEKKYDIIFLDHMMPELDGIETLHIIKSLENNRNNDTPIIALTANALDGAKDFYLGEGFTNYLSKPVDIAKLDKLICNLIPDAMMVNKE